jgi:Delta14-sterol reductase
MTTRESSDVGVTAIRSPDALRSASDPTSGPRRAHAPASAFNIGSAAVIFLVLPPLVAYMWTCVTRFDGALVSPLSAQLGAALSSCVPTATSLAVIVAWVAFQAALAQFLPGRVVVGQPLADGTRLPYRMNGWAAFWVTWAVLGLVVGVGHVNPGALYDALGPLFASANLAALAVAVFLYVYGRRAADGETTGSFIYDFFIGTALNPRVGGLDLKFFFESRPGLIGWAAVDLSFAAKQYEVAGAVSLPMFLVCLFQLVYVADYFFHEEAILTTWDIRHENFGWMLCFGDLAWVPFTYSLQAAYLVRAPVSLSPWAAIAIFVVNAAGYAIFRGVNIQKHNFRTHPERAIWGKRPEFIRTKTGSLLLTSGFWGIARHMNYLGDLLMALAWCLTCGLSHLLPYFYVIYLTILLVHRERRDHTACAAKYGADWDLYCQRVRWRIFPGVY